MLRRDGDGTLYDLEERRTIPIAELAEEVRVGRRFRAHQQGSERDCTQQVLLEVLGAVGRARPTSLSAGSGLPGLAGAVSAVAGVIVDRHGFERDSDGAAPSGNGAGSRPRPKLELEGDA
ncbi:MAG: hypothetical protein ACYDHH_02265 [Solirubrobacteraceae bacterium]